MQPTISTISHPFNMADKSLCLDAIDLRKETEKKKGIKNLPTN